MTRYSAILIALCMLLVTISPASAEMRVVGYIMGDQPVEDIAALEDAAFLTLRDGQSLGFLDGPIWVKLEVGPRATPEPMFLSVRPIHLDHIAVYDADQPQEPLFEGGDAVRSPMTVQRNGYTLPLSDDVFDGYLLIRLESENLMQPAFRIMPLAEVLRLDQTLSISFTIALSATLFYLLWAASASVLIPSWLLGSYVVRLSLYLGVLFIHSGTLRMLVATDSLPAQDVAHNLSALAYITVAQIFDYMLLRELRGRWWPRVYLIAVVMFALVKFTAFGSDAVAFALQMNNLSALVTLFLGLIAAFAAPGDDAGSPRLSRIATGFYFLLQALPLGALILAVEVQSERYQILMELAFLNYSILPGAYVTYLLFQRHRRIIRERQVMEQQRNALRATAQIEAEKRSEIGNLLQMLTHEVKTPLAMLRMSQTVGELDEALVTKAIGTISHILQQCDRVDEIENGDLTADIGPVDLGRALRKASQDTSVTVEILCANGVHAYADPNLLQIVLHNLLNNAQKYHRPVTAITAEITREENEVTLRLANLIGSHTAPDPERMFKKYYRHSVAGGQSGTGLGLYIVSQLCQRMSVKVCAEIEGDRVTLILRFSPAVKADVG